MKSILLGLILLLMAIPVYAMDDTEVLPNPQVIIPAVSAKSFEVLSVEFVKDSAVAFLQWYDEAGNPLNQEHVHLSGANYDNTVKWVIVGGNVDKTLRKVMINKITKEIKIIKGLQ
jgi:hypothetical protein